MLSCKRTMFGCWSLRHTRASRSNFWKSRDVNFLVLMIFAANSRPVAFWMDRFTTENAPLMMKVCDEESEKENFQSKKRSFLVGVTAFRKTPTINPISKLTFPVLPWCRSCQTFVCRLAWPWWRLIIINRRS